MSYTKKDLKDSQVELTITVTPADYVEALKKAAVRLSERANIKGFRKGKAPYDVLKKEVGEMAIMQEALEDIVKKSFFEAVKTEGLETIGMPKVSVEKVAPANDIVYKAIVALMPSVKLPDIKKIKVTKSDAKIDETKIDETLQALRGMHATEVLKDGKAEGTDKLVLDMDMIIDNVPVDGGQAKDHQVYLSEDHYIPGFNTEVEGLKKGDKKEFSLDFPKTHYQKHLAGKKVDFKVTVKDVYERQLPELSDDMAKALGQESIAALKELIHSNMLQEATQKVDQKAEIEILDAIIDKTTFAPIPEVLIDAERQKMFYELQRDLEKNNIEISQYLADIKKTEEEIFNDFKIQAEKRAKAALVSRQVAMDQSIVISDEEIDTEIKVLEEMYKTKKEYLDNLKKPEVRDTIATSMQNRKVMEWLKEQVLGESKEDKKK
ncbi:MAG: trigger factor [Candidatus Magasanikbacteria bacterium CG_4_9_14_0_2_um_filter_41_10]|uniref:Trigger factor n=1 Tax=Candidatus Magasanikbacteria bacterium CG_4_10_14_0_2_um_filter_41_31 TaxID=1974639 RepID=A0A2M7V369_9BACT|nr:MAG: trigger factor [Candidatus Magasanikbacteria bacterium CG1_02_41_34]PIZ92824.1 MAG: trigger factor [Candidatus Magasanikbacteria bacterium CG_4_10_14_0_2_um_filter_41_31]PJC53440.1 MAG: trigger factor [Candidatus Magasanikbacteria bacterium CG_4_9_14_0_2_um_filter_41_10]